MVMCLQKRQNIIRMPNIDPALLIHICSGDNKSETISDPLLNFYDDFPAQFFRPEELSGKMDIQERVRNSLYNGMVVW